NRIGEERLLVVSPELAHAGIGLDHGIDRLAGLHLALADKDVADHVAEMVELHRAARCVGERHLMQGFGERRAVVGVAAGELNPGLDALACDVHPRRIAARKHAVVLSATPAYSFCMSATKRWLLSSFPSAEYQATEIVPAASSPRLRSSASSMAVQPASSGIFAFTPRSAYARMNFTGFDPAKPLNTQS